MKFVLRFFGKTVLFLFLVFILPALLSQALWQYNGEHAKSWRSAKWSASGVLPAANEDSQAAIYVMSARTGRWKGGFAVHSWVVTKEEAAPRYNRYDKVGWGRPIRQNAYAPDAFWYSNEPEIIHVVRGDEASALIPKIEQAILNYPYARRGDYQIWPGPNSNTFIAHVLDQVPELGVTTAANAVGRDFLGEDKFFRFDPDGMNLQVNFFGVAGFAIGKRHGFELSFLGLVTGIDFFNPAIKLPGFGRLEF